MSTFGVYDDTHASGSAFLPAIQFASVSVASGTLLAANVAGAAECYLTQSGATALTLPTAASVWALVAGIAPNMNSISFYLRIINTNGGTLTLTAGTGNTLTGTATLSTQTTRDFIVTITGPATVTYQSIGTGTNS